MAQAFPPPYRPAASQSSSSSAAAAAAAAANLQFYPSSYPVSGHGTPSQASYGFTPHHSQQPHLGGYGVPGPGMPAGMGGSIGMSMGGMGGMGGMGEAVGSLRTGWLAAFGTEGYDGEPGLLEELGVNFGHIKIKTFTVLNPLGRIDQHLMDDADLAGPILFFLLFGTFLLFSGKVHFGYIYGLALLGSSSLHLILSLMAPPPSSSAHSPPPSSSSSSAAAAAAALGAHDPASSTRRHSSSLTFPRSASVLGYCLLPLVLTSLVGVLLPMDTALGYALTTAAIVWCTYSSSAMFVAVGRMRGMRALVAYPLALFYVGFGIIAIFSSRSRG
ncbi:MAG: hypothetical protein M1826_004586, partial [Phylliscum demangeonii]